MLRNKCAACATSLDSQDTTSCVRYLYESTDALPGCVRCQTRYCSAACRRAHWRDGHGQVCEEIARCGGAEQHNADQRFSKLADRALGPEHPDVPGLHRRLVGIRAYLEAARYQGEEWRKRARCNRALLAHVDVMDELLAARDEC